ncbi:hypothetical protein [Pectobacterium brasiliense]|uniref:hypothetical protein n=1 Tax=Pectobacterium brasiliense TaxID=180957 RepID=UPI003839F725
MPERLWRNANFIRLYVGYSVVIVTKVPLCGYYFPDDDEIVWLIRHPVLFTQRFIYPI